MVDHHLIKYSPSVALTPLRGAIKMVHLHKLLDPIGFQEAIQGILADVHF